MLVRAAKSAAVPGRRYASSGGALDRLLLDIHAAAKRDQLGQDSDAAEAVKRSPAARRGLAPRGDVSLPRDLITAVDAVIEAAGEDKSAIRNSALELYERLQKTSTLNPPPSSTKERQALAVHYDLSTSVGYLAGLMPSAYVASHHVLTVIRDRLDLVAEGEEEKWIPDRLVDYGSGTGSAAWAFEEVWGVQKGDGDAREYFGLEASINMVELSSVLFGALPLRTTSSPDHVGVPTSAKLDAKALQVVLPASSATLAKLQLHPKSMQEKKTIALAAFTLGDLGSREKRKDLIRSMWDSGAELLVVIDRGTPAGSRIVIEAREQLLMFGRREVSKVGMTSAVEVDQDLLDAGFEIVAEADEQVGEVDPSLGSFVLAPCPHDGACPLHHSTKTYCHFSQRLQTPPFLRNTKHSSRGEDDAKFSYVVVRRGQRPQPAHLSSTSENLDNALDSTSPEQAIVSFDPTATASEGPVDIRAELSLPRMIAPPMKRSGHVILEVCVADGEIERHTIPKSQGRQAYYDARKSAWGDSFPHPPKNGPQPSPSTAASAMDQLALVDEMSGKPRSKFGGDVKQRGKKAEREHGKREARVLREDGKRARREKKAARKDGGDGSFADFQPGSHGVVDVDLEIGADGRFRAS